MSHRHPSQAGYTMLEIVIVSVLALTGLTVVGSLVGTTENLTQDTRTSSRAATEHGRNLRILANVFRNVDIRTLGGFDAKGTSTCPSFQRVVGVDLEDRSYLPAEKIEWRPLSRPVWDVERPGALYLVGGGGEHLLAANVPHGGFQVRQEGNTLAIRLTTYYSLETQRTVRVTGETAISLRN